MGCWFLFHSDGNLNLILDDLVATGIDILNPIERLADMDVKEIAGKHPKLVMAGGVDISQFLVFASPQEVKESVEQMIEDAQGRILVGSSTEIHDDVPLENYLALREVCGVIGPLKKSD